MKKIPNYKSNHKSVDIPFELIKFVKNNTYSLLIKGVTGSGKTTLSLTILRSLKEKNNFFYISTRSSPKQLVELYPWLRKFIKPTNKNIDNSETIQNLSSFEDARLDEPESLFERVTNQLMDVKNPVIIIDSWDSIASLMDREARLNNERVLQTWRERANAKLIFTTEGSIESSLENIVDGVVELNYQNINDIRIRSLYLKKLRGISIERSLYFFSLKHRFLKCFDRYDPREFRFNTFLNDKIIKEQNRSKLILRTGYKDLDHHIGGTFPQNGLVTIERCNTLSNDIILLFLNDLLYNFAKKCYYLFIDSNTRDNLIFKYGSVIQNYGNIFVLDHNRNLKENLIQNQIEQKNTFFNSIDEIILNFEGEKEIITMMESNFLDNAIGTYADIQEFCRFTKKRFDLSFLILNSKYNLEKYYSIADINLKFIIICGTLFLQCSVPSSAIFGIRIVNSFPQIQLDHVL